MGLLVLDIGGSSIKYGQYQDNQLTALGKIPTPETWDEMKTGLWSIKNEADFEIEGVAIASPGAVNTQTGVVGGFSAIPYIHNFPIREELTELFKVPVSIQNDANCAALAEVWQGNASDVQNSLFLIIGSGVGGAVVLNKQLQTGKSLFGGEFGFMILNEKQETLSELGSTVNMSHYYNEQKADGKEYSGKEIFDAAKDGESLAIATIDRMYQAIATGIFNLSITFDPDKVLIGGAVSKQKALITTLNDKLADLIVAKDATGLEPVLATCKFYNDANMLGAVYQFNLEQGK
jgi:predicted NBD/HSP70 family sugar kinase